MKDAFAEIIGYLLFLACVVTALMLNGCAPKLADISVDIPQRQTCPTLVMPPIPDDVILDIKGSKVTANKGGEVMLIGYARARTLLRPAASGTQK